MKRFLPLLLLLLCLPAATRAERIEYPLGTLVQMSDIIVVGTLRDVVEHTDGETDYGQGRIEVREVIWGRVSPGDSLTLKWQNASDVLCPRVEHRGDAGREVIWLLTSKGDEVRADYGDGFVSTSERGRVEAALRNSAVVLRAGGYLFRRGAPMPFTVVYRNPSDAPRDFPSLSAEGGLLRVSKGAELVVTRFVAGAGKRAALSERVVPLRKFAPVTVEPRGERRVELDLRGLLADEPKEGDSLAVSLGLAGPVTNELRFYIGGAEAPPPAARVAVPEGGVRVFRAPAARGGLTPRARAALAALAAFVLFPAFHKLRAALAGARLARAAHGAETWQI